MTYYYEKNLQGDIVAILDVNGNTVVEYAYNIWGELVSITGSLADTIGTINPLRYRGYYYDNISIRIVGIGIVLVVFTVL